MRKLILTEFKAQTGDHEFESWRMVVVNHNNGDTESDLLERATDAFMKQFPDNFPEAKLIFARAYPTWGEDVEVVKSNVNHQLNSALDKDFECLDSALHFTNFHSMDEHPETGEDGYSDDVLIDLDGWRKDFRIGYYDKDNGWEVYQHYLDGESTKLDLKHGKWTYLPINKGKKVDEPQPSSGDVTHAVNSIMSHFNKKDT